MPPRVARGIRGLFAGAGSDGLSQKETCDAIIALSRKERPRVAYLGTPTYDLPGPQERQTGWLVQAGCPVSPVKVANEAPPLSELQRVLGEADVIVVSGGNTLFAIDRWRRLGVDKLLEAAADRGALLCGGSAGAICWFDAGHSDAGDPTSYKRAMLQAADSGGDESSAAPQTGAAAEWEYLRCPCLGFLPGLVCPHHDKTQSNGVLRATDFERMMMRHPGETAVCIDHWAALIVEGENYRVFSLPGREGSALPDGSFSAERKGRPGVWRKQVEGGAVVTTLVPPEGKLADLLREPTEVVPDPRVEAVRAANPDDGPAPAG
eukprot:TRINITY_DN28114_c0_g1_i1.p1 TRINITY_DN28114_c0_g1~~TRINITY_DN28114_c0_g1_i1.p1  ORF type:complete len:342 (+),score=111.05 TRINITY_DN28114_c0_g1_i1:66-1028(+)